VIPRERGPDMEALEDTVVDGHAPVVEEAAEGELAVEQ
jgi:hypothetical protein